MGNQRAVQKNTVRPLFARMVVIYLALLVGLVAASGITSAMLIRKGVMEDRQRAVSAQMPVLSTLYGNLNSAYVSAESTKNEIGLIARYYDGLVQFIPLDGSAYIQYGTGSQWAVFQNGRYSDEQLKAFLARAGSGISVDTGEDPFPYIVCSSVYRAEGSTACLIRFFSDTSGLYESVKSARTGVILVCLFAIIIGTGAVYYTTRQLTRPFLEIDDMVRKYSKGNYDVRIPESRIRESKQLAESFNSMADELRDLEYSRQSFVANVSHELRSPLTSMKGFLEAMQDGTIDAKDHDKYLEIVLSETRRMSNLVNDLLDLARIESGKAAVIWEVFDINELISRTLLTFEARIYEKSMEVDVKFKKDHQLVEADSAQISQVVSNLIDNAIKYSPDHTQLRISTYPVRKQVVVSISDSGQGIPEEDVPHVFDRFYKVEKAHTYTKQSGTGLGLSIVKSIIDAHGQTITLESKVGKGSTFAFTLKQPSKKAAQQQEGKKNVQ